MLLKKLCKSKFAKTKKGRFILMEKEAKVTSYNENVRLPLVIREEPKRVIRTYVPPNHTNQESGNYEAAKSKLIEHIVEAIEREKASQIK